MTYVIDIEWGYGAVHIDRIGRDPAGERRYILYDGSFGDRIADDRREYPTKKAAAECLAGL